MRDADSANHKTLFYLCQCNQTDLLALAAFCCCTYKLERHRSVLVRWSIIVGICLKSLILDEIIHLPLMSEVESIYHLSNFQSSLV